MHEIQTLSYQAHFAPVKNPRYFVVFFSFFFNFQPLKAASISVLSLLTPFSAYRSDTTSLSAENNPTTTRFSSKWVIFN